MKTLRQLFILAIIAFSFGLNSCSKSSSDENNSTPTPVENFIKFKYNGTVYSYSPETLNSLNRDVLAFEGSGNTLKRISLWSPLAITTGSHPIVYDMANTETVYQASFSFMPDNIDNADATSGTMNVTSVSSDKIEGTFSFSGTSNGVVFNVTEGSFRANK